MACSGRCCGLVSKKNKALFSQRCKATPSCIPGFSSRGKFDFPLLICAWANPEHTQPRTRVVAEESGATSVFRSAVFINLRRACARVIVVVLSLCVCVCLSVKSHLTSGASVRPENAVKYSVCNTGRKTCGIFSETVSFQSYRTSCIVRLP